MRRAALVMWIALAACGTEGVDDEPWTDPPEDPLHEDYRPDIDTDASHYPANVWVTDGMVKVQPGAAPGDVHWAEVWMAQNESESFQVHVRAEDAPIELSVEISDLYSESGGEPLAAAAIVVSREAYLDVDLPSDANGVTGLVPDALIPAVDPYRGEARNAFPVTVPAGETRSAWIDVYVPATQDSGYYEGRVTVRDGAEVLAELPVVVAIWDHALPATATLASGFGVSWNGLCVQAYGSYEACGAYPGADGNADRAVELTHVAQATMFLDYRVSLAQSVYYATAGDWTNFDETYGPLLYGGAETRIQSAQLTHLWYTGDLDDATLLADWADHVGTAGWLDRTSAYFCDEPPYGCSFDETRARADVIAAAAPTMPRLLTTDLDEAIAEDLLDRVEIMVAIVDSVENRSTPDRRADYDAWLADPAHHLWWYQSCNQHESCSDGSPGGATSTWPSYMVDATPVRNRVFQWLAFLYDIEGELYYDVDYCWTSTCGGQSPSTDPWVSQYAFGGHGDGTLIYPGTPDKIGGTTPVIVPSIRLALIRDGMEDHELLVAVEDEYGRGAALDAARTFITSTYTFDNDPAALAAARRTLGDALHDLAHPPE